MRTRLTATERLTDNLYISQSVYPNRFPRPSVKWMLISFAIGALLFLFGVLAFIAVFAP